MELLTENWAEIALALITFLSTYTALTETEKDDDALDGGAGDTPEDDDAVYDVMGG